MTRIEKQIKTAAVHAVKQALRELSVEQLASALQPPATAKEAWALIAAPLWHANVPRAYAEALAAEGHIQREPGRFGFQKRPRYAPLAGSEALVYWQIERSGFYPRTVVP